MKIVEVEQGSPEWYAAKLGVPSSSNFDKIITVKGELSKQRQKYLYRLAGERVSGTTEEFYQNAIMLRGKELEAEARELYEFITGKTVRQVGFCLADGGFGASPDGLVDEDGMVEIKCPLMATHVGYLVEGVLPLDYYQQIQGQLLTAGRQWVDFISYYPGLRPFIVRVKREEAFLGLLKNQLGFFCDELERVAQKIRG